MSGLSDGGLISEWNGKLVRSLIKNHMTTGVDPTTGTIQTSVSLLVTRIAFFII
jgi:hypothetical protein